MIERLGVWHASGLIAAGQSWLLSWVLTYAVHVVAWAGLAALLNQRRSLRADLRHVIWRMALLGPLVTASLSGAPRATGRDSMQTRPGAESLPESLPLRAWVLPQDTLLEWRPVLDRLPPLIVGLGFLRFAGAALLLRRSLRSRRRVRDIRLLRSLERLRALSRVGAVTLTESESLASPLVLGFSEICVPIGLLESLPQAQVDGVLAHELAHLERRDGLWFAVVGFVQSTLWFQPLNQWLGSRFRHSAELACDDRAVELTGDPLSLARALARVAAAWPRSSWIIPQGTPSMARAGGAVMLRVRRLTGATQTISIDRDGPNPRLLFVALAGFGVLTTSLGIQVGREPLSDARLLARPRGERPDATLLSHRMAELSLRYLELERELAQDVPGKPEAERTLRALELQQELRHVRELQAWLEERFRLGLSTPSD